MKKEQDDGYTIADMSGIEKPAYSAMWRGRTRTKRPKELPGNSDGFSDTPAGSGDRLGKEEGRMAVWGALSAALLIGFIYIAAFGGLIVLLLFMWGKL